MTEAGWTGCGECGMPCASSEYHPYAACLMFKHCRDSETVRANLQAVRQQGRVEGQQESIKLMLEVAIVQGQTGNINCKMAIVDAVNVVRGEIAQAAQDEKGVGE